MKKIMIAALTVLTVLAFSIPAMAGDINDNTGGVSFGGGSSYDLSNKVYIDYTMDEPTNAQLFGLSTVHSAGDRIFGTTSETSIIWYKTTTKGTTAAEAINQAWTTNNFKTTAAWNSL